MRNRRRLGTHCARDAGARHGLAGSLRDYEFSRGQAQKLGSKLGDQQNTAFGA